MTCSNACPTPSQAGTIRRICVQPNTHGMARKVARSVPGLRRVGRLPGMPADEAVVVNYGMEFFKTHKVRPETFQSRRVKILEYPISLTFTAYPFLLPHLEF